MLDGFPRTLAQAEALDARLGQREAIDSVLYMDVSTEELTRRLTGRLLCRDCQAPYHESFSPPASKGACDDCEGELYRRADDMPDAVRYRIEVYRQETQPLVTYYRKRGNLREVNGEGSMEDVADALTRALGQGKVAART